LEQGVPFCRHIGVVDVEVVGVVVEVLVEVVLVDVEVVLVEVLVDVEVVLVEVLVDVEVVLVKQLAQLPRQSPGCSSRWRWAAASPTVSV
jgi:hypothetical protein